MDVNWDYKNYQIKHGLKPESNHFQYFYIVKDGTKKKCN